MKLWIVEHYPFEYEAALVYTIWANNKPTEQQAAAALGLKLDGHGYLLIDEAEPFYVEN